MTLLEYGEELNRANSESVAASRNETTLYNSSFVTSARGPLLGSNYASEGEEIAVITIVVKPGKAVGTANVGHLFYASIF